MTLVHHPHPSIPVMVYRCYFQVAGKLQLPDYPGSAWRGAFGHALKRTVCVVRNTSCQQCLLKNACAYSTVFETPPPANSEKMRKYTAAPHPFVLRFPAEPQSGLYPLDVILFGNGQRHLPYIVYALQQAGKDGIGGHRQIFELQHIDAIDLQGKQLCIYENGTLSNLPAAETPIAPAMPKQLTITLNSPLRVKQASKNITKAEFDFASFFSPLLRRISMLSYFHTDTPLETDFAGLSQAARQVQFSQQNLRWYDWTRFSSRQQTEMNMGGLIGTLQLDMTGLELFWPYLWLGQWTHNGKGTSMGMGAYSLNATSLPNSPNVENATMIKP